MRRSWVPPCLDYSGRLLEWHAGVSGSMPVFLARAHSVGALVGFGMAVPRRFRMGDWEGEGYIKSFMSVDPLVRGCGIGIALRVGLLRAIRQVGVPVLRFGEATRESRARLQADYASANYTTVDLGMCPAASTFTQSSGSHAESRGPLLMEWESFLAACSAFDASELLSTAHSRESLQHEGRDSRRRAYFGVRSDTGDLNAIASVVLAEFVSSKGGPAQVALIEDAKLSSRTTSEDLRELTRAIGDTFFAAGKGQVTWSNASGQPGQLLAHAGFRRLPARYGAWLAVSELSHPAACATGTSVAVT